MLDNETFLLYNIDIIKIQIRYVKEIPNLNIGGRTILRIKTNSENKSELVFLLS
jgi:hypothetical protein